LLGSGARAWAHPGRGRAGRCPRTCARGARPGTAAARTAAARAAARPRAAALRRGSRARRPGVGRAGMRKGQAQATHCSSTHTPVTQYGLRHSCEWRQVSLVYLYRSTLLLGTRLLGAHPGGATARRRRHQAGAAPAAAAAASGALSSAEAASYLRASCCGSLRVRAHATACSPLSPPLLSSSVQPEVSITQKFF